LTEFVGESNGEEKYPNQTRKEASNKETDGDETTQNKTMQGSKKIKKREN
jgi:hypothetical protein